MPLVFVVFLIIPVKDTIFLFNLLSVAAIIIAAHAERFVGASRKDK